MNKYEWLWKTMKQHKQSLVEKFESQGKQVPVQHKSTLDVMNFLEIREQAVNGNDAFDANDRMIVEAARQAGMLIEESAIEHECPKCGSDLDFYKYKTSCPNDSCSYQVPADPDTIECVMCFEKSKMEHCPKCGYTSKCLNCRRCDSCG